MENVKPWYLSKMMLVNLIMAVAGVVAVFKPEAAEFAKQYLGEGAVFWGVLNLILRAITKDKISIN
jgi:hypothetical protein